MLPSADDMTRRLKALPYDEARQYLVDIIAEAQASEFHVGSDAGVRAERRRADQ